MAYGFGVFKNEEKQLQSVIENFLSVSAEDINNENVVKKYDKIENLECPDLRLIDSFVSGREQLYKLYGNWSTQIDFMHIGKQATKNKIFGTMWDSAQFEFYAERFKKCTLGANRPDEISGKACQDSFQLMSLIDACKMAKVSADLGKVSLFYIFMCLSCFELVKTDLCKDRDVSE